MAIIIPSIIGAACFPKVFHLDFQQGWAASVCLPWYGYHHNCTILFSPVTSPYLLFICRLSPNSSSPVSIPQSMQLFLTVWNMENGVQASGMMVSICFHFSVIRLAWHWALRYWHCHRWAGYEANTTQNEAVVAYYEAFIQYHTRNMLRVVIRLARILL